MQSKLWFAINISNDKYFQKRLVFDFTLNLTTFLA